MTQRFKLTVQADGLATLGFDLSADPLQKLTAHTIHQLDEILSQLRHTSTLRAMLVQRIRIPRQPASTTTTREINHRPWSSSELSRRGQAVLSKLEKLPFPTIAVIEDACTAEEFELALACSYRIAVNANQTHFQLPYIEYGLIPPFGATQRLPALIGLGPALQMIVSGRRMNLQEALHLDLVDDYFAPGQGDDAILRFLDRIADPEQVKKIVQHRQGRRSRLQSSWFGYCFLIHQFRKQVLGWPTNKRIPALRALDLLKRTRRTKPALGFELEAEEFGRLADTHTARQMMRLQKIKHRLRTGDGQPGFYPTRQAQRIAILGDAPDGHLLTELCQDRMLVVEHLAEASPPDHWADASQADVLVESTIEDLRTKQAFLQCLERSSSEHNLLLTLTGFLHLTDLTRRLEHPERVVGYHLVLENGPEPMVEIVQSAQAKPEYVVHAVRLARKLGLLPIVVMDHTGFLLTRLSLSYLTETVDLLVRGASPAELDAAVRDAGAAFGPCELMDTMTIGEAYYAGNHLRQCFDKRFQWDGFMDYLCTTNGYGRHRREGIYEQESGHRHVQPDFVRHLRNYRHITGRTPKRFSPIEIREHLFLSLVNESFRCLEDGAIQKPDALDAAVILGLGFPASLGGPLTYAENQGLEVVLRRLTKLQRFQTQRFQAARLLHNLVNNAALYVPGKIEAQPSQDPELPSVSQRPKTRPSLSRTPFNLDLF